jgi:hypothetical protein
MTYTLTINKLHNIRWANAEKTVVNVVADTNEGPNQDIYTPFDDTSVLWLQIKDITDIADYVEPSPPAEVAE